MSQAGTFSNGGVFPPGTVVQTITGNSGGAVGPDITDNINIVGSGLITVTGTPLTNTLDISLSGSVADEYDTNSGTAIPSLGVLNIVGGTGVSTSGSGNTVTITSTGVTTLAYTNVNTSPYVVLSTDDYLSVDCSGGAITVELPNAATLGRTFIIKDRTGSAATHNITVTTVGGVVDIDTATTFVMNTAFESIDVIGSGTAYEIY